MRKRANKRLCLMAHLIGFLILLGLVLFLYFRGFRITYAPELENSWAAVSAFASWASVIPSVGAIVTAIWIPKRIAKRQDDIALFEKRLEVYNCIKNCYGFSQIIQNSIANEYFDEYFLASFGDEVMGVNYKDTLHADVQKVLRHTVHKIRQGAFLFDSEKKAMFNKLASSLSALVNCSVDHANFGGVRKEYISIADEIWKDLMPYIETFLSLD